MQIFEDTLSPWLLSCSVSHNPSGYTKHLLHAPATVNYAALQCHPLRHETLATIRDCESKATLPLFHCFCRYGGHSVMEVAGSGIYKGESLANFPQLPKMFLLAYEFIAAKRRKMWFIFFSTIKIYSRKESPMHFM